MRSLRVHPFPLRVNKSSAASVSIRFPSVSTNHAQPPWPSMAIRGKETMRSLLRVHPFPSVSTNNAQPPCPSVSIRGKETTRSLRVHPYLSVSTKSRAASVSIRVHSVATNPAQPPCPSVSLRVNKITRSLRVHPCPSVATDSAQPPWQHPAPTGGQIPVLLMASV